MEHAGLAPDSLVRAATADGFATFAIDRLGTGRSSTPASKRVTYAAQVSTVDQVARALRAGKKPFGRRWRTVVGVGHSLGSGTLAGVAGDHPDDLSAMILTGYGAKVTPQTAELTDKYQRPANKVDPTRWGHLDAGYVATPPTAAGKVGSLYLPDTSRAALAAARRSQGTISITELTTRPQGPAAIKLAARIRVPVLVADGHFDLHYCLANAVGTPVRFTSACRSGAAFGAYQHRVLPHACLTTDLVTDSGHAIQLEIGAPAANRTFLSWVRATLWSGRARCAVRGVDTLDQVG